MLAKRKEGEACEARKQCGRWKEALLTLSPSPRYSNLLALYAVPPFAHPHIRG